MTIPTLIAWILDTLVATTLLCALVLAVRRPVARHFGPGLAYALWLMPALRMVLPPLPALLPSLSSLWPAPEGVAEQGAQVMLMLDTPVAPLVLSGFDQWPLLLLIVWLSGAALHLGWQIWKHSRLLRALQGAETLRWIGRIRVVSSADVSGPLSLGLFNPIIVLPDDSHLALDAAERDLAVAHELAHHARGDLWANGAAVLFAALHWFNPVVLYAWRAFRFDQESACDALVLNGADAPRRGAYARALAKAASGHPSAFAASMLGSDKLKERLTMLIQPTHTPLRRRIGLGLAAVALIASLGLTASTALADPAETPAPPAITADGAVTVDRSREGTEEVTRIHDGDGTTIVLRTDHVPDQAEIDRLVAQARASRADATALAGANHTDGHAGGRQVHTVVIRQTSHGTTEAVMPTPPEPPMPPAAPGEAHHRAVIVIGSAAQTTHGPQMVRCNDGGQGTTEIEQTEGSDNGRTTIRVVSCGNATAQMRISALRMARDSLSRMGTNEHFTAERQATALSRIDAQIAELERAAN